jgi:hypothetical protein
MQTAIRRSIAVFLLLVAAGGVRAATTHQTQVWQADLQIRTLEVTKSKTAMSVRVVVYSERDDEARDARLLILLPVGVGVERLGLGCAASAGPARVPSLRATVACDLGSIVDQGYREVQLTTTLPPEGMPKRFGVFAYSGTPDPLPGNNYAERMLP